MTLKIPHIINKSNWMGIGVLTLGLLYLFYGIPNHYHLFEPQLLPMWPIDYAVPVLAWTIFIYLSEFPLFILAFILLKTEKNKSRYIFAMSFVVITSSFIFVFWPTTFPRDQFPIPPDSHWFSTLVFEGLRQLDNPANAFPSLHVGGCYMAALTHLGKGESKKRFWFLFIWATAIGASTLTTKQHYLVDIIAGLFIASLGYFVVFKYAKLVSVAEFRTWYKNLIK